MGGQLRASARRLAWLTAIIAFFAALLLPGSAYADEVDPASAPTVRSLTYNVCGGYEKCQSGLDTATWTGVMVEQVTAWDADAVMLQELCIGQWAALRDALPGYSAVWTSTTTASGCAKWSADGDARFGLGVLVKSASVERYTANLTVPDGQEPRSVLCAKGTIDSRTTLACTTHLAQYIEPDNGSAEALAHIDTWAVGVPVLLGGDFNAGPEYGALDPIRTGLPGTGHFAEVDENDKDYFTADCLAAGSTECRSGEPTVDIDGTPKKFDHLFVTAGDFYGVRGDAVDPGLSDHKLLRGAAYPEPRPGSGVPGDLTNDGRPDLVAVQDEGNLRLYSGLGDGLLAAGYRQIGTGGWTNALVTHRGDWSGDGREDLVVRIGDRLWVYPNTGSGALGSRLAMGGRPTGWTSATAVVSAGDLNGDGTPDLVVRDGSGLWLYPGDPAATAPALSTGAPVQLSGADWSGLDVLAPGDANGDGSADLWARDRTTGTLWLYPNTGTGTLGARQAAAGGTWTAADRPLVTAGDLDADGRPDLWTTTNADTSSALLFHAGTDTGLGDPVTVGVGGWQWMLRMA
ncbi:FG-GAP-like repeat-containing protein [Streptomyces sp. NPDC002928]|uniref:FG-GAP-like repeat-containing protein n=1 Tax=Streptomyces sp. NPDC002928 TaxID=3154440 RepID=UPI0033B2F8E8